MFEIFTTQEDPLKTAYHSVLLAASRLAPYYNHVGIRKILQTIGIILIPEWKNSNEPLHGLSSIYVVVQFYPWFKFYFLSLFLLP